MTVDAGCPPPILDDTATLTALSPIAPHRPGCFSKSYTLHFTAGTFVSIRLLGRAFSGNPETPACNLCDTYLYLVDAASNIIAESDDAAMGLNSHIDCLIEITGDYTIESTTFAAGDTGTIQTTVNAACFSLGWAGNSAVAGTGTSQQLTAPQSVAPLTWSIINGSLPSGLGLGNDFSNPTFGRLLFGATDQWGLHVFKIRVTDTNGFIREQLVNLKAIAFEGFRIQPTFILSPPIGSAFTYQMIPIGGVTPYTFQFHNGALPGGITFDGSTGTFSGVATGAGLPSTVTYYIIDSQGDYSIVGISWVTCTGQNPVNNLVWSVAPITPNPPGDTVAGAISGGDGAFDLVNIYPGFGACVQDPTSVTLTCQLCNPLSDYEIQVVVRMFGELGNSPACPAIGHAQLSVSGLGIPAQAQIDGVGGQLYDISTDVLTATVPQNGVVNIGIFGAVDYATMHLVVTVRPLIHP